MTLFHESGLPDVLSASMHINGKQYALYGDAAYILRPWLQVAFDRANATAAQAALNTAMSAVREAVEWSYKDLKQMWSSQDSKRFLRVRKAPIALMYRTAALLNNFKTCLHAGGQVGLYFLCQPPSLQEYVNAQ